jgi:predicted amidohydrolase
VTSSVRVAAIQPRSHSGLTESRNVEDAVQWLEHAASEGAQLVVFPEGYPGPTSPTSGYDATPLLAEAARRLNLHVVAGSIEADAASGGHAVVLKLIDGRGQISATYRRTSPRGPYVYQDIPVWGFEYVAAEDPPVAVATDLGVVGLLVCSELYVPELSRVLALQGATILVYPAGGAINELADSWRTMLRARAIENLAYTVASQNLYEPEEQGIAQISSPEAILAEERGEGMVIADLDLDRLTYLRQTDERIEVPKPYRTIPGVLRWRRPELYRALVAEGEE